MHCNTQSLQVAVSNIVCYILGLVRQPFEGELPNPMLIIQYSDSEFKNSHPCLQLKMKYDMINNLNLNIKI
jgi:hypothetical protein